MLLAVLCRRVVMKANSVH